LRRHALRDLDTPAVYQVIGYAGGAKRVATYRRFNPCVESPAAHHAPDIAAQHRPRGKVRRLADRGAEQRPLAVALDASGPDVGIQIPFELVMAGHFVQLTATALLTGMDVSTVVGLRDRAIKNST